MTEVRFGPRDRQGPKAPSERTPVRVPGSVRRTTTLDGLHPDGPGGPTRFVLRARDLRTAADGAASELGRVEVRLGLERPGGVLDVTSDPPEPRLGQLVGTDPSVGWRRRVAALLPDHGDDRSLLYLVLDALSAWLGLSRFALHAAGDAAGQEALPAGVRFDLRSRVDLCAGWQAGGTLLGLVGSGQSGGQFVQPLAPVLESADDPLGWHSSDPLPPFGARRRRRVDVIAGSPVVVDAMFRDTAVDAEGREGVLHEYSVALTVDPDSMTVLSAEAEPRSLPYQECPEARVSAAQLVGHDVRSMRTFVGHELRGTTTCTHLNELYRTFGDIGALVALVRS